MSSSDVVPAAVNSERRADRRARAIIVALAVVTSFVGFGWTLGGYFLGDDFGYVERFYAHPLSAWPRLFRESWAGNMWGFQLRELRPITALSFMLDGRVWEGNAFGFRLTNLLLHAACGSMVGLLAWRAGGRQLVCGAAAAVLFALHPAHAEPVQWITGRVDVLATCFYLGGFCAFLVYRERGSAPWLVAFGALYFAAAFSKEFGLTLPLMCLCADLMWREGAALSWRAWRRWAPYLVGVVIVSVYYFCRQAAFGPGGVGTGMPDLGGAAFHTQLAQRQLTYLGHLFPPANRWLFDGAPLLTGAPRRLLLIIGAAGLAVFVGWWFAVRKRSPAAPRAALFFGFGWYAIATLPLVVTYISPRHLYLASAGVCVAVALLVHALVRRGLVVGLATLGVAFVFVQQLRVTMQPWHEAAVLSGEIMSELRRLEPELQRGSGLLLDVHETWRGAYVWTWAAPFVLRPPFLRERWDDRLVVLESRGLYVDWERWHEQPAIAAMRDVTAPTWIIHASEHKALHRIPVTISRIRPGVERFAAANLKESPHESWRRLVDDLAKP